MALAWPWRRTPLCSTLPTSIFSSPAGCFLKNLNWNYLDHICRIGCVSLRQISQISLILRPVDDGGLLQLLPAILRFNSALLPGKKSIIMHTISHPVNSYLLSSSFAFFSVAGVLIFESLSTESGLKDGLINWHTISHPVNSYLLSSSFAFFSFAGVLILEFLPTELGLKDGLHTCHI